MDGQTVSTVEGVTLTRRGHHITGTLILTPKHLVFSFIQKIAGTGSGTATPREIWICYPIIERISKARGSSWVGKGNDLVNGRLSREGLNGQNGQMSINGSENITSSRTSSVRPATSLSSSPVPAPTPADATQELGSLEILPGNASPRTSSPLTQSSPNLRQIDHYTSSHIRIQCKDFTYYSFDFVNDKICTEVFQKLSTLVTLPRAKADIQLFYAYSYRKNVLEQNLSTNGWNIYDATKEYQRLGLISDWWRVTNINENYSFCPSYPRVLIVPSSISDNVLKHAGKFRLKQRIPAIVYRHRFGKNGNVIARCAQPLVGLKLQNRSLQDEKLIGEIFETQQRERGSVDNKFENFSDEGNSERAEIETFLEQPQRNLIVDLRPLTNAMAQHALGAGTENIDNYRGKSVDDSNQDSSPQHVDKIFCNIDNIHVMRDSLNKLNAILNELDKNSNTGPMLQQSLTKTQWLHRLSIILQSVDRITKSVHLNNTNILIHCSDGWDRTSQVSALLQLCLDPYYRTIEGFMVLIEKEWVSFGFKFSIRGDHGGCIGAKINRERDRERETYTNEEDQLINSSGPLTGNIDITNPSNGGTYDDTNSPSSKVASFFQRAATHIKNTAAAAAASSPDFDEKLSLGSSNEKSPIFHQFLDCVYQLLRQHPESFQFNSRFLKRLFYHHYSCQYGTFLCDSEREMVEVYKLRDNTVSVWDYFNSRTQEFTNQQYKTNDQDNVLFFNFTDIKWWFELYGRSDEEMNGLSNSLDRKFARMNIQKVA